VERSKQQQFADLVAAVAKCDLCPRMRGRRRVLGPDNGNLDSEAVFVAEAPGRLGADKFGKPLHGDQTGRNFEEYLRNAGLDRESLFITNAVLCNPRRTDGNNATPSAAEIRNCSRHLATVLDIVKPKYVVTLGRVALSSLAVIKPHKYTLSRSVATLCPWGSHFVYPLFHPSPRACIARSMRTQLEDYRRLADLLPTGPMCAIIESALASKKPA